MNAPLSPAELEALWGKHVERVEIDLVVVVQFEGDKLSCERIYWDQATVLRQVGLLKD